MAGRSSIGIYGSGDAVRPAPTQRPRVLGTALWLDATDSSSIYLNNTRVSLWEDLSGLSNHAMTDYPWRAPTVLTNGIGSATALKFDDQFLDLTNKQCMAGMAGVTFMMAFGLGDMIPLSMPFGNVGTEFDLESVQFGSALNWEAEVFENIGSSERMDLGTYQKIGYAKNKNYLLCIAGDTTDITRMYINGTQVATWNYGDGYMDYLWAVGRTHGMGYGTINWCFTGTIGEIRIYDHRLTTTELDAAHTAMKSKWGIP